MTIAQLQQDFPEQRLAQMRPVLAGLSLPERLQYVATHIGGTLAFSTGFGPEGQVVLDVLLKSGIEAKIFTLDTGRLFAETYHLLAEMQKRANNRIEVYTPDTQALQTFASERGIDSFYESVDNRKACCHIRKIEPLNRALEGADVWITGLRASHSAHRAAMRILERDPARGLIKFNPVIDWTHAQIWDYIHTNRIPYNALHDESFPSIGCAPCTRAVAPGEDERAGRWWWEAEHKKECGLHIVEGRAVRKSA